MMITTMIAGLILSAAGPAEAETRTADAERAAYEAARAQTKRDPDAHVRLAAWCEAHGLEAERLKHLAIALVIDPKHAAARGLLGLVSYRGKWKSLEAIRQEVQSDAARVAALTAYNEKRTRTPNTAESHWQLALWCERNGLQPEATAHLATVMRLDPKREGAWKRLGYKRYRGQWLTDDQIRAMKAEAEVQKKADRKWKPQLEAWKAALEDTRKRAEAERSLSELTDPRAVPAIWRVFGAGNPADQTRAAQLFGQIDAPGATRAVATLAAFGKSDVVRRVALETLTRRDARDCMDYLIGLIRDPVKYEVKPVGGPGSPGALFIEGKRFNVQRLYAPPPEPNFTLMPGDAIEYDQNGLPVISRNAGNAIVSSSISAIQPMSQATLDAANALPGLMGQGNLGAAGAQFGSQLAGAIKGAHTPPAGVNGVLTTSVVQPKIKIPVGRVMVEAKQAAEVAKKQLEDDIAAVKKQNELIHQANGRVIPVLEVLSRQHFGEDGKAWSKWWTNLKGYGVPPEEKSKSTVVENVALNYQPQAGPTMSAQGFVTSGFHSLPKPPPPVHLHHCFAGGTPVHSLTGLQAIESIQIGDQVLVQDPETGALRFEPVVAVYHNPPNQTYRIKLKDETLVATGIHRFWKAYRGWVMARELKPGDAIRTLAGVREVLAVEPGPVQPVYNLEVAHSQSFFVGQEGALVHDNSLVLPATDPFDAPLVVADAKP